ncbi:Glutathione S-transferase GST-4.5 [Roseobacter fucihabitans]|uniref:Glutathione S-transferase GST-4.5 n=1 Tax=Roseobacter fucihabitans TaxID=1537242 RepID=A0ABZ2BPX0_9RHOB|nr:glutathione S-transferase family protein [Roseobacter litoralis]MBC6966003.1 Glutathione S-transferase GST-4.5 [Roseobacter litoralis]
MNDTPYILHYAPDNASMIIRIALEEIRAPYVTRLVDRHRGGQNAPDYLALNPAGKIPVLETRDGALFETGAILLWLADRHGGLGPAPTAPGRGDMLKWLFFLSNTLHPALRMLFYPGSYAGARAADQERLRAQVRDAILCHLRLLDANWRQSEHPCISDIYLAPMLRWLRLYPADQDAGWFDLTAFPALHSMAQALETRPSVIATQAAEGLGPHPFTAPRAPCPPEGSPT